MKPPLHSFDRRTFLGTASAAIAAAAATDSATPATQPPPVREPRATSGDPIGPAWEERLTLTVGNDKGDLSGTDEKVIQAAIDSVARFGGGTVRLLPGTFRLRNAVYLA